MEILITIKHILHNIDTKCLLKNFSWKILACADTKFFISSCEVVVVVVVVCTLAGEPTKKKEVEDGDDDSGGGICI